MGRYLPAIPYADRIRKKRAVKFGGYAHTASAGDGDIFDMMNMASDGYPLLCPRGKRGVIAEGITEPQGIFASDGLYYAANDTFYDRTRGTAHPLKAMGVVRCFCALNSWIVIMPDKMAYDAESGVMKEMEATVTASATFTDGSYGGVEAAANTISASVDWSAYFMVGDSVEISGSSVAANNTSAIIREIDAASLRFYENSFTLNGVAEEITVKRTVPDMDFLCENENRMWGCKGDAIFATKLGDIFNWNVFDGLDSDSYAVDVGSAGDFTGCISYRGYPVFFKEENIYKVYGSKPSNFQVMGSASLGVAKGSSRSLAVAGEVLFYLSRIGVVAYSGGIPNSVAEAFGDVRYRDGVGGSDGVKYYISMLDGEGRSQLFAFDTRHHIWEKEDDMRPVGAVWQEDLIFLTDDGRLIDRCGSGMEAVPEEEVRSAVEFADFTEDDPNVKGISKLQIRLELIADEDEEAAVTLFISYDGGEYEEIYSCAVRGNEGGKRSYYIPVIPRRCDHFRLKIEGLGQWRLYSLVRESYSGSELY